MSDRITFSCSECSGKLAVPGSAAGKKIRCPKCQGIIAVPATISSPFEDLPSGPKRRTSEPPRAARDSASGPAEKPRPTKRKRPEPSEDSWLNEDLSGNQAEDAWDQYGNDAGNIQGLPPRTKKKKVQEHSDRPILRGTGNEPPRSSRESAHRCMKADTRTGSSLPWLSPA